MRRWVRNSVEQDSRDRASQSRSDTHASDHDVAIHVLGALAGAATREALARRIGLTIGRQRLAGVRGIGAFDARDEHAAVLLAVGARSHPTAGERLAAPATAPAAGRSAAAAAAARLGATAAAASWGAAAARRTGGRG